MKPKLLDLFCGAGGASMGYHRAGFEVVGVDIKSQPHYPFEFHHADALNYPLDKFDCFHASPPCQAYVDTNKNGEKQSKHPRLIEPIRIRLLSTVKPFVIENIHKAPLMASLMLCGTMFGLRVFRHRYFEFSFPGPCAGPYSCNHWGTCADGEFIGVYAFGAHGRTDKITKFRGGVKTKQVTKQEAMGIDWMNDKEINEAIPPAYTEYIGKYLIQNVIGV